MDFNTEQENFWAGQFGSDYISRNQGHNLLASNLNFFSKAFGQAGKINSCIEFGANIIMTDYPEQMINYLNDKGLHEL